mmetsp:Transcript_26150/g.80766  ORF Transcript_26150/g.80766 Transcript_26150/m.80766 type:complete len:127 (+) Transcript_26150:1158-1538(+)
MKRADWQTTSGSGSGAQRPPRHVFLIVRAHTRVQVNDAAEEAAAAKGASDPEAQRGRWSPPPPYVSVEHGDWARTAPIGSVPQRILRPVECERHHPQPDHARPTIPGEAQPQGLELVVIVLAVRQL